MDKPQKKPEGATPTSAHEALNSLGIDWLRFALGDNTPEPDGHLPDTTDPQTP